MPFAIIALFKESLGSPVEPGLKSSHSSNVTIQNCSFQYLQGQAVVLLGAFGDVNICDCKFSNNNDYIGHGSAIHYSSNDGRVLYSVVTISSCEFSNNVMNSLIYFENALNFVKAILINSTFYRNQGISLYAINSHIYLIGRILFKNNSAENGAGIYINNSNIIFDKNSKVTFIQNTANDRGGAVFSTNHSICLFDHNSNVIFSNNYATRGIIYSSASSNVTFKAISEVTFSNNIVNLHGAAIYSADNSHVTFKEDTKVTLTNNSAIYTNSVIDYGYGGETGDTADHGGIVYITDSSNISFQENSTTVFCNNTADHGGGIYIIGSSNIFFQENSNTVFSNNTADYGGGMYIMGSSNIFFQENSNTVFSNNTADYGGGIYIETCSNIFFQEKSNTVFGNNTADYGGGIYIFISSNILFQKASTTEFSNNAAHYTGTIDAQDNCSITFDDNAAVAFNITFGMTVFADGTSKIKAQGNFNVIFNNHSAKWCNNTCLFYTGRFDSIPQLIVKVLFGVITKEEFIV